MIPLHDLHLYRHQWERSGRRGPQRASHSYCGIIASYRQGGAVLGCRRFSWDGLFLWPVQYLSHFRKEFN